MSKTVYSSEHGFSPSNGGEKNREALQRMLDIGGTVVVDEKGTYDVSGTVFVGSDTTLEFSAGTYVRRIPSGTLRSRA